MSQKKYFEMVEGSSAKFWEISVEETKVLTRFGRIGSQGQSSEKEESSAEKAVALYEKLIAEKTKKGYQEVQQGSSEANIPAGDPVSIKQLWDKIVTGDTDAFRQYLSLLGPKEEDRLIIAKIVKRFKSASIAKGDEWEALEAAMVSIYDEDEEDSATLVSFSKPYEGPALEELPASVLEACKIANGVSFESLGGGYLGFMGISKGGFTGAGGWDPGAFEEDEIEGLTGAMDYGQNWVCFNENKKNKLGEPQLVFVSHEGGSPEAIKKADKLTFGQVTLRVISQYLTDTEDLDQVYN